MFPIKACRYFVTRRLCCTFADKPRILKLINLKGVNKMSFRNPDKLKKKKNIVKKVTKESKTSTKTVSVKKPKEKS